LAALLNRGNEPPLLPRLDARGKFWPAKAPLAAVLPKPAAAALGGDLVAGRNYFKVYTTAIRGRAKDGRALSAM
jgi:hypothetical protein